VRLRSRPNCSPALRALVCSNRFTASDLAVFEAGGMSPEMSRQALWKHANSLPRRATWRSVRIFGRRSLASISS
jgi:hypothetical protein